METGGVPCAQRFFVSLVFVQFFDHSYGLFSKFEFLEHLGTSHHVDMFYQRLLGILNADFENLVFLRAIFWSAVRVLITKQKTAKNKSLLRTIQTKLTCKHHNIIKSAPIIIFLSPGVVHFR